MSFSKSFFVGIESELGRTSFAEAADGRLPC